MKKINILFWVFTGLYAAVIIFTSISGVASSPEWTKYIVTQLGYPAYFVPYISVAKILGGIALLVPGFPRVKEWAYAGLAFDLVSTIYSFISIGTPVGQWAPMLVFVALLACSYIFYHKKLNAASRAIGK
jgi:hypothetical protein